jgi:broad specificity phosphatase PhoE
MVKTRSWMPRAFSYRAASATIIVPPGWMVLVVVVEVTQPAAAARASNESDLCMPENVFFCMTTRIHLVRHGVSAHVHDGSWVNADRARRFMEKYDAAGIRDDPPPPEAMAAAATADVLAASTLPRAIESVRRLAPDRNADLTPLLREINFESPNWLPVRLPISTWDAIDYALTGYRIRMRRPTPDLARAREAAEWLLARVTANSTLLAVTHGGFRRFLWASLVDRGWTPEFTRKHYHNWSVWSFRAP